MTEHHDLGIAHETTDPTHLGHTDLTADPAMHDTPWMTAPPAATDDLGILHGDPAEASHDWFLQQGDGYCVPASLTEVLSQLTGHRFADESVVSERFAELGLPVTAHGETLDDSVTVLNSFGVDAHVQSGATLTDLEHYLDQGRPVVLGVNAETIWGESGNTTTADHALLVSGIDEERGVVILSDPGNPQGDEETVPLDVFEHAWADSGNQLLVTDQPAAEGDHATSDTSASTPGPVVVPTILNATPPTFAPGDGG